MLPRLSTDGSLATAWNDSVTNDSLAHRESWYYRLVVKEANVFRQCFGVIVAISLFYIGTVFPYRLCFVAFRPGEPEREDTAFLIIEKLIDVVFWFDLMANFFFSYTDQYGNEVTSLPLIACHYLKGFFFINLVACIPPEFIVLILSLSTGPDAGADFTKGLRLSRVQKVSRLVGLTRLLRLVKVASFTESPAFQRLAQVRGILFVNFIGGLFWIVHLVACGWYLCAALHDDPSKTWLGRRNIPFDEELTLLDADSFDQWLHAMYFVLTVFTTVGFGDITAITSYEILYVCMTMIVGAVVHSIIVGEMIKVITRVDQETIDRSHQRELVDGFARHTELDAQASKKLIHWARSSKPRQGYDRDQMRHLITSSLLPHDVLMQLPVSMFGGELTRNDFVTSCFWCTRQMPARFPALLALMLNRRHYIAGELVYHACDPSWNLCLVSGGTFANIGKPGVSGGSCHGNQDEIIMARSSSCSTSLARLDPDPDPHPTLLTRLKIQVFKKEQCSHSTYSQRGLYPYQLFGQGRYFGDTELFENAERRSSVRCESSVGSLLVLHKRDLKRLLEDFPAFLPMWAVMAKHRELRRKHLLKRLVVGQKVKSFAAITIQDFVRSRSRSTKSTIQAVESRSSLTSILQEPVAQHPGTNARSRLQLPNPPVTPVHVESRTASTQDQAVESLGLEYPPVTPVHLESRIGSTQDQSVENLRADVDSLRDEMRAGFRELQMCLQAAICRHN